MRDRGIQVQSDLQQLPSLYWLPKLHKTPYGSRFIAASNKCTTKQLSSILAVCLSAVLLHYQEYCNGIFRNCRVNCFWVINNSQQVLSRLFETTYEG